MKENVKAVVRQIMTSYLEQNNCRKTPERFAVLDMVYSMSGHFTLNDLSQRLAEVNFPVSRATLYSTLALLVKLRLVVCHRLMTGTVYEACYSDRGHCYRICTSCGKMAEFKSDSIEGAVSETHVKRFRKEGFTLYVYGICSACLALRTRQRRKEIKNK